MNSRVCISAAQRRSLLRPASALAAASLAALLTGCTSPRDGTLEEFARWRDGAMAQAQSGALAWSEFYRQSFDRLTALPSSLHQDRQLEHTVLLLSTARKYEAQEISAQEFAATREQIEQRQEPLLR